MKNIINYKLYSIKNYYKIYLNKFNIKYNYPNNYFKGNFIFINYLHILIIIIIYC